MKGPSEKEKVRVEPEMIGPLEVGTFPPPDSCVFTVSNESSDAITAVLNSTSQVTVTVDPTRTGLPGLLLTVTEDILGTERKRGHH